jgi:hypothetical protein
MRLAILLAVAVFAAGQESSGTRPQTGFAAGSAPKVVDAKLHSDVIKLVELDGTRTAIQNNLRQLVDQGKASIVRLCTGCDPAFSEEWAKRMLSRISVDDFIDVYVRVYEEHFSDEEVMQLIALRNQVRKSQPRTLSNELKQKLAAQMISVQSEILGGTTQVGAKLGGEIGREIQIEHPEYFKNASTSGRPFEYATGDSRVLVMAPPTQQAGKSSGAPESDAKPSFEDPAGIQEAMEYDEVRRRFGPPSAKVTSGAGEETLYYSRKDLAVEVTVRNGKVTHVRKSGPAAQATAAAP